MQTRKRIAMLLALALLLTLLCPTRQETAAAGKRKNAITELGIMSLPENSTIEVGSYYNFNPDIISTELGKGSTTGLVYWEVNAQTNTAGVTSSRWGYVYPVYAGSFEIRAVAFASGADMKAWKSARIANGYVEDATAGEKYVTAYSDWVTIQVTAKEEGYAVARTQYQLNRALKNEAATDIHIVTNKERSFTIGLADYGGKTLTVNAPNSDVVNAATFRQINVEQIKSSTFHERGQNNRFRITAEDASFRVEEGAHVQNIEFAPKNEDARLNVVLDGGQIDHLEIAAKGEAQVSGDTGVSIPVTVAKEAAGAVIRTDVKLEMNVSAPIRLEASETAAETVVHLLEAIEAAFSGAAEKLIVDVAETAAGAVIMSETTLEIKAAAWASVELTAGAEGTKIDATAAVEIRVKNETAQEVVVTGEDGKETIAGIGSEEVITPEPIATPEPTAVSTASPVSPVTPVSPSMPTATPMPTEELTEIYMRIEGSGWEIAGSDWDGVGTKFSPGEAQTAKSNIKLLLLEEATVLKLSLDENSGYELLNPTLEITDAVTDYTVSVQKDGEIITLGRIVFVVAPRPELTEIDNFCGAVTYTAWGGATMRNTWSIENYDEATIAAFADAGVTVGYQWYEDGKAVSGATSDSYEISLDNTNGETPLIKNLYAVATFQIDCEAGEICAEKSSTLETPLSVVTKVSTTYYDGTSGRVFWLHYSSGSVRNTEFCVLEEAIDEITGITLFLNEGSGYQLLTTSPALTGAVTSYLLSVQKDGEIMELGRIVYVSAVPRLELQTDAVSEDYVSILDGAAMLEVATGSAITATLSVGNYDEETVAAFADVGITLGYQWYKDGTAISGATSSSYEISEDNTDGTAVLKKNFYVTVTYMFACEDGWVGTSRIAQ